MGIELMSLVALCLVMILLYPAILFVFVQIGKLFGKTKEQVRKRVIQGWIIGGITVVSMQLVQILFNR